MKRTLYYGCILALGTIPAMLFAASPARPSKPEPAKAVDLFAGIDSGEVEAVIIFKDSTEGTVMVKNKSDQPLTVKMPAAFAGVPILAQRRGGGGGVGGMGMGGGGGLGGSGGGMQGMMGGMGGGMMGGMGGGMMGGMGGGMFNIAPDKVQKIKIAGVCMDHGLNDPNPRVPYKPVPAASYAKDPAVIELVKLMLRGQIDQHSAQAATWHLQNGLSWEELANKVGVKHIGGLKEPYFTKVHLERAFVAARVAKVEAEKAPQEGSSKSIGEELARQQ